MENYMRHIINMGTSTSATGVYAFKEASDDSTTGDHIKFYEIIPIFLLQFCNPSRLILIHPNFCVTPKKEV